MAITKKPQSLATAPVAADRFIEAAPDGIKARPAQEEGIQITLRMSKEQLDRITAIAKRQGIPRASYIKRAVFMQVDTDEGK